MKFFAKTIDLSQVKTDCLVVTAFKDQNFSESLKQLQKQFKISFEQFYSNGEFEGQNGQLLPLYQTSENLPKVLLLGLGDRDKIGPNTFRKALGALGSIMLMSQRRQVTVLLDEVDIPGWTTKDKAQACAQALECATYKFTQCKSRPAKKPPSKTVTYCCEKVREANAGLKLGQAIAEGMNLTRELGDMPANLCTPSYLGSEALKLSRKNKLLKTQILSEKQMKALAMESLLSVSAGSAQNAQLIVMEYQGAAKSIKPHVLVGKGITFDTGGISLKPGAGMDEMKFDMCGAASVFGVISILLKLEAKINVVGIVAAAENMPSGTATKPGDVVTSMSGKTIEILNTDAEGRLVLCDVLTYVERYKPQSVVDIATLTGACAVALGNEATGLFSHNDEFAQTLLDAGNASGDRAWRMPLWEEYQKQLDSNFADMANIGGRYGGAITAACFLSRFAESFECWAHLDIAGTAWYSGKQKGATGRPVPLLIDYLLNRT